MNVNAGSPRPHVFLAAILWLLVALSLPAAGQVHLWQIGGTDLTWDSQAQLQAGLVAGGTSVHPVELGAGQNLTARLKWREGQPEDYTVEGNPRLWDNSGTGGSLILVDGIDTTSTGDRFQKKVSQAGRAFFFDLGVAYPVNRVRFYPPPSMPDLAIHSFELYASDGTHFTAFDTPQYESLRRVEFTDSNTVDLRFPVTQVRFLQLRTLARDAFALAEVEIYGQGFVPSASYESKLHAFAEGAVNFGRLRLRSTLLNRAGAGAPRVASAAVQVRSGADDTPLTYYREDRETGVQTEVTKAAYEVLIPYEQGPIREDGDNWSPWSAPVALDSTGVVSLPLNLPSPRQYLQFRIAFAGDAAQAMQVDQLACEYSEPLATQALGEVALAAEPTPPSGRATASAGRETTFVCDVKARFSRDNQEGFRGLRLASFPAPQFVQLQMGDPLVSAVPDSVVSRDDGFEVYFPRVTRATNAPLRVTYRNTVLEYVTQVDAWLLGAAAGLPQPLSPGDAGPLVNTSSLQVLAAHYRPAVDLFTSNGVVTPNGDGANDAVTLSYILSQFADQVRVRLEVFDLGGRCLADLVNADQAPGGYQVRWTGCGDDGSPVPPGIYVCRLAVTADAQSYVQTRSIAVAY